MTDISIKRLCYACIWLGSLLAFVIFFTAIFVFGNRTLPIKYGGPGSVTIEDENGLSNVSSGQTVNLCIHNASWIRLCEGELYTHMTVEGRDFDLQRHVISLAKHTGPIIPEKKCREIKIPLLGKGISGQAKLTGFAKSTCWPTDIIWPLITDLPEVNFTIIEK